MKLWSDSWTNGDRIPARHAAGRPDGAGGATFSDNLSPHLAWSDLPAGTQSLVMICHDFDVPTRADDVNQPGREVPADLPRADWFKAVESRPSAKSKGSARADRIVSIDFSGPATAIAKVECQIPPRYFTDYLTLLKVDGRWQVISKSFHTVTKEA